MKPAFFLGALFITAAAFGQANTVAMSTPLPAIVVNSAAPLTGTWMYGNFSTAEYWSKSPSTYLGKAFSMAIAFVFKPDGTYEQYFTSQTTDLGGATYHQSFTKGRYTVDEATKTLVARPVASHYKRTRNGAVQEDRDMRPGELAKKDEYRFSTTTEPTGTPSLLLTIAGTKSTLTFAKKNF